MARSRNIKPGFFANDELAQCEYGARLMFAGLWTIADREGRLEDRPLRIKGQLFPYDNCDAEVWLRQLAERGFICRYEVSGRKCIQIANFKQHQNPHVKEPESTIPAPDLHHTCLVLVPECGIGESGISKRESVRGNQESEGALAEQKATASKGYTASFERWYGIYPRKVGKQEASAAFGRALQRAAASDKKPFDGDALDWLCDVTQQFANSPAGQRGQFVPHPATWLNQGRYEDDQRDWQRKDDSGSGGRRTAEIGAGQVFVGDTSTAQASERM